MKEANLFDRMFCSVGKNDYQLNNWEEFLVNTYMANKGTVEREWFVVDATDLVLGRMSTRIATILRGKHKPTYTPHVDTGDNVIVINAAKVRFTGKKLDQKIYYHHTGFPGGLKEATARRMMERKPEFVIKEAVRGMLPKGPLGRAMLKKLHVYAGSEHVHQAQKPVALEV